MVVDFENGTTPFSNIGAYPFKHHSGSTPSNRTGPSSGALGSNYYIYLETSLGSAYNPSDQAILSLTNIRAQNLSFYYHMFGSDMGTLSVEVYSDGIWFEVFSVSGQQQSSHTESWKKAYVSLSKFVDEVHIRFIGKASGGYRGDMALDEIFIDEREYQAIDFETELGEVRNIGSFSFKRHSGKTPSRYTGPSKGANKTAHYIYLETSVGSANRPNNSAILELDNISPKVGTMMFYYHMYGGNIGTLSVEKYKNEQWIEVWRKSGQQQSSEVASWKPVFVDISAAQKIRFVATAAGGYRGDIAIDQIELNPTDNLKREVDFDSGLIWENVGDFYWKLNRGTTPSYSTGPNVSKSAGYYAYFETSSGYANSAGDTAILESPYYEDGKDLYFIYSMAGRNIGTLSVEAKNHQDEWVLVWTKTGQQQPTDSEEWIEANFNISKYSKVRFKAVAAGGYLGDIAINSILIVREDEENYGFEFQEEHEPYQVGQGFNYKFCAYDIHGINSLFYRLVDAGDWVRVDDTQRCHVVNLGNLVNGYYTVETKSIDSLGHVVFEQDRFWVEARHEVIEPNEENLNNELRRVTYIHTDILGSPAAETNPNGELTK